MAIQDEPFLPSGTRRQAARRALMATARKLFARQGFTETSVDQVVLGAAVARGAFFLEFEGKRDMFRALIEDELEQIARRMDEALAKEAESAFDRLQGLARVLMESSGRDGTGRMVFAEGPVVLGCTVWAELGRRHVAPAIESALTSAIEAGEIVVLPVAPLASALSAACQECARALADEEGNLEDLEPIVMHLLAGLRRAERQQGKPAASPVCAEKEGVPTVESP